LKAGRSKSCYVSIRKRNKKRIGVPVTRSYFYLFLVMFGTAETC
jgi:hypothetical protein